MIDDERDMLLAIRAAMMEAYSKDSCIAATALAKEYLAERGFDGDGVQVETVIFNEAYRLKLEAGLSVPEILRDPDAHSIGIGVDGGFHVVYLGHRNDEVVFVDLSLDQASRPLRALPLGPIIGTVDRQSARRFMHGGPLTFVGPARSVIGYRRRKKETFRRSPNWTLRDATIRKEILGSAAKLLEEVRSEQG